MSSSERRSSDEKSEEPQRPEPKAVDLPPPPLVTVRPLSDASEERAAEQAGESDDASR